MRCWIHATPSIGLWGALYSGGRRRGVTTTVVLLLVYNLGVRRRDAEDVRKRKRKSNSSGNGVAGREKRFIFGQRAEDNYEASRPTYIRV